MAVVIGRRAHCRYRRSRRRSARLLRMACNALRARRRARAARLRARLSGTRLVVMDRRDRREAITDGYVRWRGGRRSLAWRGARRQRLQLRLARREHVAVAYTVERTLDWCQQRRTLCRRFRPRRQPFRDLRELGRAGVAVVARRVVLARQSR